MLHFDQFELRARQVHAGGQQVEVGKFGVDARFLCRRLPDQHLIHGLLDPAAVHADAAGGIPLRVHIDQEGLFPLCTERRRKVDRRGGLAHAALLVCYCDDFSHSPPPFPKKTVPFFRKGEPLQRPAL